MNVLYVLEFWNITVRVKKTLSLSPPSYPFVLDKSQRLCQLLLKRCKKKKQKQNMLPRFCSVVLIDMSVTHVSAVGVVGRVYIY